MRVQYFDIARLTEDEADALGVKFRLLRELLRTSDVVSLHVPLNDSTRHMIGAEELALMKPTCDHHQHLARAGDRRGGACTRTLAAGKIFGAGLDVFDQEPPPVEQSAVQAGQRGADRALRGSHLGQSHRRASAMRSTTCSASPAASRRSGSFRSLPELGNSMDK